jgi:protein disulfide-isomerase-like protein
MRKIVEVAALVILCAALVAGEGAADAPASDVVVLTTKTFRDAVKASATGILVEFYAPWCGHCKNLAPIWDKLATQLKDRVPVAKVDCTVEQRLQQEQGIRGFPTIKLFRDRGAQVVQHTAARDIPSFMQFLVTNGVLLGNGSLAPPPVPPHLRYFEPRGRGELIRLILEESGAEYTDTRLTWDQWVTNEKPNAERYAFGQVPQLTIDGKDLVQSGAIVSYLGRKFALYGDAAAPNANLQQTNIDVVLGGFEDLRTKYNQLVYDKEFANKKEEYITKVLPVWLGHYERLLASKSGIVQLWFANNAFSVADLEAFDVLSLQVELKSDCLSTFPLLSGFMERIMSRPSIQTYLRSGKRPVHAHGSSAFYNNEAAPAPRITDISFGSPRNEETKA